MLTQPQTVGKDAPSNIAGLALVPKINGAGFMQNGGGAMQNIMQKNSDSSMEDILASLRKIISDDFASDAAQTEAQGRRQHAQSGMAGGMQGAQLPQKFGGQSAAQPPSAPSLSAPGSQGNLVASHTESFGGNSAIHQAGTPNPSAMGNSHVGPTGNFYGQNGNAYGRSQLAPAGQNAPSENAQIPAAPAAPLTHLPLQDRAPYFQKDRAQENYAASTPYDVHTKNPSQDYEAEPYDGHNLPVHDDVGRDDAALLSQASNAAIANSFDALSNSMAMQKNLAVEAMAREMLRPMLKAWLDEHMPAIVERLVRAEIERVARGSRPT